MWNRHTSFFLQVPFAYGKIYVRSRVYQNIIHLPSTLIYYTLIGGVLSQIFIPQQLDILSLWYIFKKWSFTYIFKCFICIWFNSSTCFLKYLKTRERHNKRQSMTKVVVYHVIYWQIVIGRWIVYRLEYTCILNYPSDTVVCTSSRGGGHLSFLIFAVTWFVNVSKIDVYLRKCTNNDKVERF